MHRGKVPRTAVDFLKDELRVVEKGKHHLPRLVSVLSVAVGIVTRQLYFELGRDMYIGPTGEAALGLNAVRDLKRFVEYVSDNWTRDRWQATDFSGYDKKQQPWIILAAFRTFDAYVRPARRELLNWNDPTTWYADPEIDAACRKVIAYSTVNMLHHIGHHFYATMTGLPSGFVMTLLDNTQCTRIIERIGVFEAYKATFGHYPKTLEECDVKMICTGDDLIATLPPWLTQTMVAHYVKEHTGLTMTVSTKDGGDMPAYTKTKDVTFLKRSLIKESQDPDKGPRFPLDKETITQSIQWERKRHGIAGDFKDTFSNMLHEAAVHGLTFYRDWETDRKSVV